MKPCMARLQRVQPPPGCDLGNHPGVLHYDEKLRVWWAADEEIAAHPEHQRGAWDDSWMVSTQTTTAPQRPPVK
jgi:hypothetical protein